MSYQTLCILALLSTAAAPDVEVRSPGLATSRLNGSGELVEDWGKVRLVLEGEALAPTTAPEVSSVELDGAIPGARLAWRAGPVAASAEVWRAPVWPAGLDVLELRLEETRGAEARGTLLVELPASTSLAQRTVKVGSRTVLLLPDHPRKEPPPREWGYLDEATALPGWATPLPGYDPAFANIRAGMGGVAIAYRFAVEPGAHVAVVLGFCESYWEVEGSRSMSCKVEGAPAVTVDPLERWGRHHPGGVSFDGEDANGDGVLEVLVLPAPGTPDRNPILNAIWLFEPELEVDPAEVITGRHDGVALRYVDVGGSTDQSILPGGRVELPFALAPKESVELTFLVACPGATLPKLEETTWTTDSLRAAAREVWEDWSGN